MGLGALKEEERDCHYKAGGASTAGPIICPTNAFAGSNISGRRISRNQGWPDQ